MKSPFYTLLFLLFTAFSLSAQIQEATLLYTWNDESITPTSWLNGRYNDCWGVEINGLEIAIIGGTDGVHFFDITEGSNAVELPDAYVAGTAQGANLVHRDYHSYQNYLYAVADEGASTLQVIDMSGLPDETTLVYNSDELMVRAHNIFIDTTSANLYAFGVSTSNAYYAMSIVSLADPENPELVANYPGNGLSLPYVHDGYVRNDTAYLNCGGSGFYVVDFNDPANPVLLGTMTSYPEQGYNHAGWLHPNGQYYYLADETHGRDVKVVDVSDFSDIHVVNTFNAESGHPSEIPHNLIVHEGKLYVSYYYDGLQVYDLTDPAAPARIAAYDTYPGNNDASYKGAWGVYPMFSSGRVIISDMQTGLYLFEKIETTVSTVESDFSTNMVVYPTPASSIVWVQFDGVELPSSLQWEISDALGRQVAPVGILENTSGQTAFEIPIQNLPAGSFFIRFTGEKFQATAPLIIMH